MVMTEVHVSYESISNAIKGLESNFQSIYTFLSIHLLSFKCSKTKECVDNVIKNLFCKMHQCISKSIKITFCITELKILQLDPDNRKIYKLV